jgi:hypothetical protein
VSGSLNPLLGSADDTAIGQQANALLPTSAPVPLAPPPSLADAWTANTKAYGDFVAQQRAAGVADGTLDPDTGWPTQKGYVDAARQTANGLLMGTTAPEGGVPGFTAFHGSGADFNAFGNNKIGTGEGNQAFGYGHYVADAESVAQTYRDAARAKAAQASPELQAAVSDYNAKYQAVGQFMSGSQADFDAAIASRDAAHAKLQELQANPPPTSPGHMYQVQINADPAHFLDWDKPLSEQTPEVRDRLSMLMQAHSVPRGNNAGGETTGSQLYNHLYDKFGGDAASVAQELHGEGIPGIRYLDGGSRADGSGTSNHVIFDPATIAILRKYGIAGLMAGGGAAASAGSQAPTQ